MANIEFTTPKDFIIYMNVTVEIFLHFHHTAQIYSNTDSSPIFVLTIHI